MVAVILNVVLLPDILCSPGLPNMEQYVIPTFSLSAVKGVSVAPELKDIADIVAKTEVVWKNDDGIGEEYADYSNQIYLKNHQLAFLGELNPD